VPANAQPELMKLKKEHPIPDFYFARRPYAGGVLEGLRYFGVVKTDDAHGEESHG
jgi:hypothetical protein